MGSKKNRCAVEGCTAEADKGDLCTNHAHQRFFAPKTFGELREARKELGLSPPDGDRVSLYPMKFEDALKAIFDAGPAKNSYPKRNKD